MTTRDELIALCRDVAGLRYYSTISALHIRRARDLLARIEEEDRMYEAVRRSAEYYRLHENEPNTAKE